MPEEGRTQPEFSLGERLARVESILDPNTGLKAQITELLTAEKQLTEEKIKGVRTELSGINAAQKEAISKAETATENRLNDISKQADRRSEVTNARIGALEQGGAGVGGEKRAIIELQNRQIALVGILIAVITAIILYH